MINIRLLENGFRPKFLQHIQHGCIFMRKVTHFYSVASGFCFYLCSFKGGTNNLVNKTLFFGINESYVDESLIRLV